ncbi:uncharacterized protein LOC131996746 [Stomoxys calcitrans]|uniref:uncharacterized protein LOC131996746 n=1 Tax=Stomoxys calcitrans TaxID=35570 RepID=UPI0027E2724B|nr:uncharacterized protein LOC131996746 [Stomoxys calcitrans]
MSKCHLHLIFGVILLQLSINLIQANDTNYDLSMVHDFIEAIAKQRRVILCMVQSCDALALEKIYQIEEAVERELKQQPTFSETHEFESLKLDKAINRAVDTMLALEPNCKDVTYVCPTQAQIPKYINEYTSGLADIITNSKCINSGNIKDAVDILGKSVEYVEQYHNHSGNFMQRVHPAAVYVANEFAKLCDRI